ncbi:flagellar basal body-associated FliL family protein [Novosphingobium sediminicola]|uniref:Flagellar protein FliL n=1 Tax=Novosphingobium sediminicola TaxID=563162 RepID=A0A7W6CIN6_9SPHN|nr:flagellar basal body-associated FliL family protein [Novosphingobium sediminicola]MBB3956552.1 flagellar FliL protein [Novosphingobium sediminicola]
MSKDKTETGDKPAKGKSPIMLIAITAVLMLAVGGGGAFAMVKMGIIGGGKSEHVKEDNSPKLIRKGQEDPYAAKPAEGGKEGEGAVKEVEGEGGSPYKTSYYTFSEDFTSNLKNSSALVQISVACSTHRDGRVLMWLKKHELAIRSEMLAVLADTPEEEVSTVEGKEKLQKRLTASINHVLTEEEGFGGIDAVYFKSFLVQ